MEYTHFHLVSVTLIELLDLYLITTPSALDKGNLGGLVEHILRFGLIGILFFLLLFAGLKKILSLKGFNHSGFVRIGFPLGVTVFFLMSQDSSVADPIPWFIFFLFLKSKLTLCRCVQV